jgi:uncharacterized protein (DUF433 family)
MGRVAGSPNPLALGFYSVPEAARLIEGGNAQRIRGWLRGFPKRETGPLIVRQYEPVEGIQEIGFLDLMELRLIETLREHDVQPRTIRKAIVGAREVFKSEKPFATDKIVLRTDGKHVFVEEVLKKAAKEENDTRLWNLVTKQYEHYELIERSLLKGVTFDPETHFARTWTPRPEAYPRIIIDPRIAYGKPITPQHIPAETIYEIWKAENENIAAAADWFGMPIQEAEMAVGFQRELIEPDALAA